MRDFYREKPYLENQFEEAVWIGESGLDAQTLCQGFDRYLEAHKEENPAVLRAGALKYLLDNCQISINPHTIFCHKLNLGVRYDGAADKDFLKKNLHEAGPDIMEERMFYPRNRRIQEERTPVQYQNNRRDIAIGAGRAFCDFRHACPDWNRVFQLGIPGLRREIALRLSEKTADGTLTREQEMFYGASLLAYDAILDNMKRILRWSLKFDVAEYSAALGSLLQGPPTTTYEAILLSILFTNYAEIGYEKVRTLGLLDLMYQPFYEEDLRQGRCSREQMKEMLRYFFYHWHAFRRGAQQPFGMGGANELTYMILDVYEELNIIDPKIHLRVAADVPEKLLLRVAELIRKGCSSIMMIYDESVYKGYALLEIPREDAEGYLPEGCYETFIMGKEEAFTCASWLNIAKQVELTISGGEDPLTGLDSGISSCTEFDSYAHFEEVFFTRLHAMVERTVDEIEAFSAYGAEINPSPVLSATMENCLITGKDIYAGGMVYNNTSIKCYGIGTAVDSLLAVEKLVFDEKILTFPQLRQVLQDNWQGHEKERQWILKDPQKYGNNLHKPDSLARKIYDHLAQWIIGRPNCRGGIYRMGADSVDFAMTEGAKMGATPDGRRAGEPISKNLGAVSGMQRRGITAFLQSTLNLGLERLVGAAPMDFMVHPSAVEGEAGLQAMATAFRTYFEAGGVVIHGNVLSAETLESARENPEQYRDLQIRVCGFNDYFVNLLPQQQEQFIRQARAL